MGGVHSEPPKPIDLVPPSFSTPVDPLSRLSRSPFDYLFSAEDRDRVFEEHHASAEEFGLGWITHPTAKTRIQAQGKTSSAPLKPNVRVNDYDSFRRARLGLTFTDTDWAPYVQARVHAAVGGTLGGHVLGYDPSSGLAGFAKVPRADKDALRLWRHDRGLDESGIIDLNDDMSSPELGVRLMHPMYNVAVGMHWLPRASSKLWAVKAFDDGFLGGFQLSSPINRAATFNPKLNVGLSYAKKPNFEISAVYDGVRSDTVFGYVHHFVVRRDIKNPFEKSHIKGMFNYIDLGMELRQNMLNEDKSSFTVGTAWQLNKNLMLKAKAGSDGYAISTVLKAWSNPGVTLALTLRDQEQVGISLTIAQGEPVQYSRGLQLVRGESPSFAYPALEPSRYVDGPRKEDPTTLASKEVPLLPTVPTETVKSNPFM